MRFSVLGPLAVEGDPAASARAVMLPRRQRQVLARLLVSPNRVVPAERILDDLWPDPWSPGARASLQAQVSRLRSALGDRDVIRGDREGYHVRVGPDALDAWRFERLLGEGRDELLRRRPLVAAARLDEALAMWRGDPFDDLVDVDAARGEIVRLGELRTIAALERVQADLDAGLPADALARAEALGADHPFDERLWTLRVTARFASGRRGDALAAYEEARRRLRDDLGLAPGPELREAHRRVLDQDGTLGTLGAPVDPPTSSDHLEVGSTTTAPPSRPLVDLPPVRYASHGGLSLAYRTIGDGALDVVWVPDYLSHLDVIWEHPRPVRFLQGLGRLGRLVTYDKRGQGLSDRVLEHPPAEVRAADLLAVLDDCGSRRALLIGTSEGAEITMATAVAAPQRVAGLVLFGSGPVGESADDDVDWAIPMDDYVGWISSGAQRWGTGRTLAALAPSTLGDEATRAWYGRLERQTITPTGIVTYARQNTTTDYRSMLSQVRVPTLVLHRRDEPVPVAAGRFLASHIRGARYVELDGADHIIWFGDLDRVLEEISSFASTLR